mgnify:CR=1 FL=1
MKRILCAFAIVMTALSAAAKDGDGHRLTALWADYKKAVKADRPRKQASTLEEIKRQAEANRLAWDFYDASQKYVRLRSESNWKLREDLTRQMEQDLDRFGEPVAIIYDRRQGADRLISFIKSNEDKLKSSSNPEFWSRDPRLESFPYGAALPGLLGSDYDYALWCLFSEAPDNSAASALMHSAYAGSYPLGALMKLSELTSGHENGPVKAFAAEHRGDAVGILAEGWLLDRRFHELSGSSGSSQEDYLSLRDDCLTLQKRAGALREAEGRLAACCSQPSDIIRQLTHKSIISDVKDGVVTVALKNLKNVKIEVRSGRKTVFKTRADNPKCSFYLRDSVTVTLPEMDDGDYELLCSSGKTKSVSNFGKHTLSIASRCNSDGQGIYVTDYMSGKPLDRYTLTLFRDDTSISRIEIDQNGFTTIPEAFTEKIIKDKYRYRLQASCRDDNGTLRKSKKHWITDWSISDGDFNTTGGSEATHCMILTDRSAFRPEETVRFKTLLYSGSNEYKAVDAGNKLTAVLYDAENKEISRQSLVTGEYGSAAGEFSLEKRSRGGLYSIAILQGEKHLCGTSVLVDEFVTPSFTLIWDKDERTYLPGDWVSIKGGIRAYSGHQLGEIKASYNISRFGSTIEKGTLTPDTDGRFEIRFRAVGQDWSNYMITVKVSDATGETLEFYRNLPVQSNIYITTTIEDTVKGNFTVKGRDTGGRMINSGKLRFSISTGEADMKTTHPSLKCSYEVVRAGKTISRGESRPGEKVETALGEPGLYTLRTTCIATSDSGIKAADHKETSILFIPDSCQTLNDDITSLFMEDSTDSLDLRIGASCGPVWAAAELYGNGNTLLDRQKVRLEGIKGEEGSLKTIHFPRRKEYPLKLSIKVLWFKDKESYSYGRDFNAQQEEYSLPLNFSRFLDTTAPGTRYTFEISTLPGVECAATIFDAASETLRSNIWHEVTPARRPLPAVSFSTTSGEYGESFDYVVRGYGMRPMMLKSAATMNLSDSGTVMEEEFASDEAVAGSITAVREDFTSTVAWEPFLRSDKDGRIEFSFRNADKLSTYYVQLFAHDRQMHNSVLRREMKATLPVKISAVEPLFLHDGDRYVARVTVSNSSEGSVGGKVSIRLLDGKDYRNGKEMASRSGHLEVKGGGSASFECEVQAKDIDNLGLLASFTPDAEDSGSDAVFVSIPVYPAVQTIMESHSALFKAGMDRDSLIRALRGKFVNADGSAASAGEISILQMLRDAVPALTVPSSDDALSLSEALYADWLLTKIPGADRMTDSQRDDVTGRLVAARNPDGGFGWFRGMSSSPVVTATLLERFAKMGAGCPGALAPVLPDAVRFLDRSFLRDSARPLWCGGLSLEQYLYVRSLFPDVKPDTDGARDLKAFRKAAKDYLVPSGQRGLNGLIFAKARRMKTLKALLDREGGDGLADFFGIKLLSGPRMRNSLEKDILSLAEYAEPHNGGGMYYPNAVLPWRGLLESELYAHSMLCDLLADCGQDSIAEGIRLWIMVQKETQQWESDPAYIEALASVLAGSAETLQTKVIALTLSVSRPFGQVKAAGNGFRVSREYRRDGKPLREGDLLHVGDKISATYSIWSEENRSFVRLTAPRCAAFRPVEQKSGHYGWMARPLSVSGWASFTPQGYRSVLADRTEFWFDSYPEEKTSITEEFFVTQEGCFQAPAVEIESLYAPHYRANDKGAGPIRISSSF